jgi:hypothetical protein
MGGLKFSWGDEPEVAVEPSLVEPVNVLQGGVLHVFKPTPGAVLANQLSLVETVEGFGQGVVIAVAPRPDRPIEPTHLGDLVYQIERSGLPARKVAGGAVPRTVRTDWLVAEVIPSLRQTVSVLLIHGLGNPFRDWAPGDQRLIEAFLGQPMEIEEQNIAGKWLGHQKVDRRVVVYMKALAGPLHPAYLTAVRRLVQDQLHDHVPR